MEAGPRALGTKDMEYERPVGLRSEGTNCSIKVEAKGTRPKSRTQGKRWRWLSVKATREERISPTVVSVVRSIPVDEKLQSGLPVWGQGPLIPQGACPRVEGTTGRVWQSHVSNVTVLRDKVIGGG